MGSPTTGGSEDSVRDSEPLSSPSSTESGRLLVVSGPSGAGKSTLLAAFMSERRWRFSVSVTTRPPRPGEIDGIHYIFTDRVRFLEMVAEGELLEWAEYGGHLYGTPRNGVETALAAGTDVVLDIEIEGAAQVAELFPDAVLVWVQPPSQEELERRLRDREDTSDIDIVRRLERARRDAELAPKLFTHVIVNDDVERAVQELIEIADSDGWSTSGARVPL